MSRSRRRLGAVCVALAVVLGAAAFAASAVGAAQDSTYSGEGEAAAVHLRVNKESALPAGLNALDSFVPLARVRVDSPVGRSAQASPAYDTTITNAPGLICLGTGGAICLPAYPLLAQVEQPGARSPDVQTPTPELVGGEHRVGAGYGLAHADEEGARARSSIGSLRLGSLGVDPDPFKRAADALRDAIRTANPSWTPPAPGAGHIRVGAATASTEVSIAASTVTSSAAADLGSVELFDGLVRIRAVHSEVTVTGGANPVFAGGPTLADVTVGPYSAVIDRDGIRLTGQNLPPGTTKTINDALANARSVVSITAGELASRPRPGGLDASAAGLHVVYRREVAPNAGTDIVDLAIGMVRVSGVLTPFDPVGEDPQIFPDEEPLPFTPVEVLGELTSGTQTTNVAAARRPTSPAAPQAFAPSRAARRIPLPHMPAAVVVLSALAGLAAFGGIALLTGWQVIEE